MIVEYRIRDKIKLIRIEAKGERQKKKDLINESKLEELNKKIEKIKNERKRKQAEFERDVFRFLYQQKGPGEKIYKLTDCTCDGLLETRNGEFILLEFKGGINNYWHAFAMCQIIMGKKKVESEWKMNIKEGWIIFGDFLSGDWTRETKRKKLSPARYPLEIHDAFTSLQTQLRIKLLQFKNGELQEYVTR